MKKSNIESVLDDLQSDKINKREALQIIEKQKKDALEEQIDLQNICAFSGGVGGRKSTCSYPGGKRRSQQVCGRCRVAAEWDECFG